MEKECKEKRDEVEPGEERGPGLPEVVGDDVLGAIGDVLGPSDGDNELE